MRLRGRLCTLIAVMAALVTVVAAPAQGADPGPAPLTAQLAVLQRPQAPTDLLPAGTRLPTQPIHGAIVPGLTRLVGSVSGTSIYLVVSAPPALKIPLWSPSDGDQAWLVSVNPGATLDVSQPIPAADLNNPDAVGWIRPGTTARATAIAEIVPDGVARVVWTYRDPRTGVRAVDRGTAGDNVVTAPVPPRGDERIHVTWFTADGSVFPTSTAAQTRATKTFTHALRLHQLHVVEHQSPVIPSAQIIAGYPIFAVTRRTVVRGSVISRPALATLPAGVVGMAFYEPGTLDLRDAREVTSRGGTSIFIVAGPHQLCVFDSTGGGCATSVSAALKGGVIGESGTHGHHLHIGILPPSQPDAYFSDGPHHRVAVPTVDGALIYRST